MMFYMKNAAFNVHWYENPERCIDSFVDGEKHSLTAPGMDNHAGDHSSQYPGFPELKRG